ncbi:M23 family metallopeptidase [Sphaerotilus sp.]|uniref:M23 family metallopeptidase n=1 Tax=Sphaerotilus sp. TaxID=2093942 RepID=UPI002ACE1569|nr:M23 family metallopeptidase [Sphaerotilus sp.]MDZ7857467.1 M23 family metallopeptidase [Sphaerotilus sp.]
MDILITHGGLARTRSMHVRPVQLWLILSALVATVLLLSGTVYHFVFLKAVRDGWPVVSQIVGPVLGKDAVQRERYQRDNIEAMAQKVGELQAKLLKLEAVGERVSGLAGLKPEELRALDDAGKTMPPGLLTQPGAGKGAGGGPFVPASAHSGAQLDQLVEWLDAQADRSGDVFVLVESRLLERRLEMLMVPSIAPVDVPVGSGFGFRLDPFNRRAALHTGLDFAAPTGTPIRAAAGGRVLEADRDGAYGLSLQIDHGNGLVTRYAHASQILVKPGEVVRRGQEVALVGSTGRSTGPHLHFEVLLGGVPQDPAKFLARGESLGASERTSAAATPSTEPRKSR